MRTRKSSIVGKMCFFYNYIHIVYRIGNKHCIKEKHEQFN